jgi:hypothetical protein
MDKDDATLLAIPGCAAQYGTVAQRLPVQPALHLCRRMCHDTLAPLQALPGAVLRACHKSARSKHRAEVRPWLISHSNPFCRCATFKVEFSIKDSQGWPWTAARSLKAVDGISFDLLRG